MVTSQNYRVSIEANGADARSGWEAIIAHNGSVALAKTPQWIDCICSSGRFADSTVLFRGEDGRRLVLPRVRSTGIRVFESPANGWDLGADASGFLSEGEPVSPMQARALSRKFSANPVCVRVTVSSDEAQLWASVMPSAIYSTVRTAHALDLRGGFSTVWPQRFTSKVRSMPARRNAEALWWSRTTPADWSRSSMPSTAAPSTGGLGNAHCLNGHALAGAAPQPAEQVCDSGPQDGRALHHLDGVARR